MPHYHMNFVWPTTQNNKKSKCCINLEPLDMCATCHILITKGKEGQKLDKANGQQGGA